MRESQPQGLACIGDLLQGTYVPPLHSVCSQVHACNPRMWEADAGGLH